MADIDKMDRTWLCSVVFMDIVKYSSQSVEQQIKWKNRFNGYLAETIQDVPPSERVILDTGDGAAVCFLGAPEAAMFAALQLCRCFALDEREQQPGMRVRIGINLGPVKLMKDINGALNAIGDGINAGQRIMSFAGENQILVSQSFFEVVSRLSDDYKILFQLKGVEKDKHIREHTVYHLVQPGSEKRELVAANPEAQAASSTPERAVRAAASPKERSPQGRAIPWLIAGAAVAALAAAGVWHFHGSSVPATSSVNSASAGQNQTSSPNPAPTAQASEPAPAAAAAPRPDKSTSPAHPPAESSGAKVGTAPEAGAGAENSPAPRPPSQPESAVTAPSADARAAYNEGARLLDLDKPGDAAQRFDDAIRASPNYVNAYVGRAEARRKLDQYESSLEDCNKVIQIKPDDPRGYNCRGLGHQLLDQYDAALLDFNEAIGLSPDFALAYDNRGTTYSALQQYDRAVEDFSEAIRLRPRDVPVYLQRAAAYDSLRQYDKAIQDYTEAIQLQPNNLKAYLGRASSEAASGDRAAAMADRRHVQESRKNRGAQ